MLTKPNTISDLIANWPTIGDFAVSIGCGYEAARQMRNRNSIAPEHWQNVVAAAKAKEIPGIDLEWLQRLRVAA